VLHVGYKNRSIPVAYAGDGVFSLIVTTLELASQPGGVVLIEEPEVHQYPAALRQTAAVIAARVTRGVQVILSTHSLELIDALVAAMSERKKLDDLRLIRLSLDEGNLKTSTVTGPDVAFARNEIDDDLR
jgi:predicted ATPase